MDASASKCSPAPVSNNDSEDFKITPEMLEELRRQPVQVTPFAPCLCGKLLNVIDVQRKWHSGRWNGDTQISPGVNYTDLLCDDCRKEFDRWPRIVCLGCRRLMGFVKPGKESTGFEFEMDRHYHIENCPQCKPKVKATPVLEHEKFCRVNGIRTSTNQDLVQEIEQKTLQGEEQTAKMRAEFEASKKKQ